MENSIKKFKKGDRVKLNDLAIKNRLFPRHPNLAGILGTVISESRQGARVHIKLDGKNNSRYHSTDFWEVVKDEMNSE